MGKVIEAMAGQRLQSVELAESMESQGRASVALRVARALLRDLPAGERELALRAQLCIARSHLRLGASDQAAQVLKDLEQRYGEEPSGESAMRIALERGRLHYLRSEWQEAEAVLMQAMERAQELGQGGHAARILRMLSMVYREAGSIPLAEEACNAATESARAAKDWLTVAHCISSSLSLFTTRVAQQESAIAYPAYVTYLSQREFTKYADEIQALRRPACEAINIAREMARAADELTFRTNLAQLEVMAGQPEAARETFEAFVRFHLSSGSAWQAVEGLSNLAWCQREMGEGEAALASLEQCLDLLTPLGNPARSRRVLLEMSLVHEMMGNFERALFFFKRHASAAIPPRPLPGRLGAWFRDQRKALAGGTRKTAVLADAEPKYLLAAERFILANLSGRCDVGSIAQSVGISRRALQMAFRRHRRCTIIAYVRKARLRGAYYELLACDRPDASISRIAEKWGYHRPSRFSADFRNEIGVTPRDVLKRQLPAGLVQP